MTLQEVRKEIDRVDGEIKKLFAQRMTLADNVARVKAETGDDIFKPDREVQIIENLTEDVDASIVKEYTALIKRIMEISRKYQYGRTLQLRDCLGISYLEQAPEIQQAAMVKTELYICNSMSKDKIVTVGSYRQMAEEIEKKHVDAGIGIMEEIGIGVSDELHQLLSTRPLYINRCDIVKDNGINKKVVTFTDHLVVEENHNRLKVMFVCMNKSGSLSSILSMISDYGVNLTEIHSRPNMEEEWNYEFMVEMNANLKQQEIQALVYQLMNETEFFKILGSYYSEM
jgi:chorismate mutase/prephenate dehydratase